MYAKASISVRKFPLYKFTTIEHMTNKIQVIRSKNGQPEWRPILKEPFELSSIIENNNGTSLDAWTTVTNDPNAESSKMCASIVPESSSGALSSIRKTNICNIEKLINVDAIIFRCRSIMPNAKYRQQHAHCFILYLDTVRMRIFCVSKNSHLLKFFII